MTKLTKWLIAWALCGLLIGSLPGVSKAQDAGYASRQTYTASGSSATFVIPFPYLAQSDIQVYVGGTLQISSAYTFPTTGTVLLGSTPTAGTIVQIRRATAIPTPDVTFLGGPLRSADLNTNAYQAIYSLQEKADGLIGTALVQGTPITGDCVRWATPPFITDANTPCGGTTAATVRTLAQEATLHNLSIGKADDTDVFNAAKADMDAAKASGGLIIALPSNTIEYVQAVSFGNNSGYVCLAVDTCVLRAIRTSSSAASTNFVALDDQYATGWILSGVVLDGTWQYGRGTYSGSPETDPWIGQQNGLSFLNQFNGISDATYRTNSTIGASNPHGLIENVIIANFGGLCGDIEGSGANVVHNVAIFNCGTQGLYWNQYDSKISDLDIGQIGASCFKLGPNGSTNEIINLKTWFCGGRQAYVSGDTHGIWNDRGSGNHIRSTIQDTAGTALYDNGGIGNDYDLQVGWQGQIALMDANTAVIEAHGASASIYKVLAQRIETYNTHPNVTRLITDSTNGSNYAIRNQFNINEIGFPSDFGVWVSSWFSGPLDFTNLITLNAVQRVPRLWQASPNGSDLQLPFAATDTVDGGADGLIMDQTYNNTLLLAGTGGTCIQGRNGGSYSACNIFMDHNGVTTVNAAKLITPAVTFSTLPTSPVVGQRSYITDDNAACTFGTTATGSGTTKCGVVYNGSNWVAG